LQFERLLILRDLTDTSSLRASQAVFNDAEVAHHVAQEQPKALATLIEGYDGL
jgi:hypothetical protein